MLDCGLDLFVSFVFYENELLLADNDKVDAKADYRTQISCVWLNKEQKGSYVLRQSTVFLKEKEKIFDY